ncbi:MAG: ATP phosphoribosyltransferase regulatory subunit [Christensenellales bacterium]|jgi:ATP phosphoribosyltransferase regulatory subunit
MGQHAEETLLIDLGALYERHGYARHKPSTFEAYDFYARYRSFLRSEPIVSFTAPDGRLMAFKPDVTLSIAKNAPATPCAALKAYYRESVYRKDRKSGELREIMQAGLELIGVIDRFSMCEVVRLALLSLQRIGKPCELALSHLGFVEALLDGAGLSGDAAMRALSMIGRRSAHELQALLREQNAPEDAANRIQSLVQIYGPLEDQLPALEALNYSNATNSALAELKHLADDLGAFGESAHLSIDFSMVNDMDYYGGVIFKGYVQGISHCVLSGGRYDRLIEKLGKQGGAIGFAVYPDLIEYAARDRAQYDADTLILYDDDSAVEDIARAIEMFEKGGQRVLVQRAEPPGGRFRSKVRMRERGFELEC